MGHGIGVDLPNGSLAKNGNISLHILKPFAPMAEFGGAPHPSQGGVMVEVGS